MTTETLDIHKPRLIDVILALEERDEVTEAEYYRFIYAPFLSAFYDIEEEKILCMTIDEISQLPDLPAKPLKYEGWDTFYFGRAAFDNKH